MWIRIWIYPAGSNGSIKLVFSTRLIKWKILFVLGVISLRNTRFNHVTILMIDSYIYQVCGGWFRRRWGEGGGGGGLGVVEGGSGGLWHHGRRRGGARTKRGFKCPNRRIAACTSTATLFLHRCHPPVHEGFGCLFVKDRFLHVWPHLGYKGVERKCYVATQYEDPNPYNKFQNNEFDISMEARTDLIFILQK